MLWLDSHSGWGASFAMRLPADFGRHWPYQEFTNPAEVAELYLPGNIAPSSDWVDFAPAPVYRSHFEDNCAVWIFLSVLDILDRDCFLLLTGLIAEEKRCVTVFGVIGSVPVLAPAANFGKRFPGIELWTISKLISIFPVGLSLVSNSPESCFFGFLSPAVSSSFVENSLDRMFWEEGCSGNFGGWIYWGEEGTASPRGVASARLQGVIAAVSGWQHPDMVGLARDTFPARRLGEQTDWVARIFIQSSPAGLSYSPSV